MIDREVRNATDLYTLVSQYVPLKRRGNIAVANCPFHDEKTPSFRVNLPGHRHADHYRCFGCGAAGDAIDFLRAIEGISQFEAVKRLASDAGMDIPQRPADAPGRSERLAEQARSMWWRRDRWKRQRAALDLLLANGPPDPATPEYFRAEHHGQLLRYLESRRSVVAWSPPDSSRYIGFLRGKIIAGMRMAGFLAGSGYPPERDSSTLVQLIKNLPY